MLALRVYAASTGARGRTRADAQPAVLFRSLVTAARRFATTEFRRFDGLFRIRLRRGQSRTRFKRTSGESEAGTIISFRVLRVVWKRRKRRGC